RVSETAMPIVSGFDYRGDFIAINEETALVEQIGRVQFSNFELRGFIARRRVAFFGGSYDAGQAPVAAMPEFLMPLRARVAEWAGVGAEAFIMALINEYAPGAPIGWHRDAPQYGIVAGVSLLSSCRMKFRPYVSPAARRPGAGSRPRTATHEIVLERR